MLLRIETIAGKKLMGKRMQLSLTNNTTAELWKSFMQQQKEIQNAIGSNRYSLQVYDPLYFTNFNPATPFEKWAAVEVADLDQVPAGMETFYLPGGLYAVFLHRGAAATGAATFQYIFQTWLPQSDYVLDNRPHFEILGAKYKNNEPDSEEEIWIPVKTPREQGEK